MDRSKLYKEIRRWIDAPCEIEPNSASLQSAIARLRGRFEETAEFDPSHALGEVMDAAEELFLSHITASPSRLWKRCDVVASQLVKWRTRELTTDEATVELIEAFDRHAIPFDCFTILPYEERCRSMRGIMTMLWIHHDQLLASDEHLQVHRKHSRNDTKDDYCSEFVEELESAVENMHDWFSRTIDEIATRVEFCLHARLREVKAAAKKSTFLNLIVDSHKRSITNTRTGRSLDLMGQPATWSMFFAVYSAGSKGSLPEQVEKACHGEWSNHRATKSKLNKALKPLGVRISPGEWCLVNT